MASYAWIECAQDLPEEGGLSARARERREIDFKTYVPPESMAEHAKDVAAFANGLGGVLLVGADIKDDKLVYPGIVAAKQSAARIAELYEQAGRLCSPPHHVDAIRIEQSPGVVVVAANVDPAVDHLVGSPGTDVAPTQPRPKDIPWRFPRRVSSHTDFIEPEKVPMYVNAEIRRAFLLLQGIPQGGRAVVRVHFHAVTPDHRTADQTHSETYVFRGVELQQNAITLATGSPGQGSACRVPLLDVLDVWQEVDGLWQVKVTGQMTLKPARPGSAGTAISYRPLRSAPR